MDHNIYDALPFDFWLDFINYGALGKVEKEESESGVFISSWT